MRMKPILLAVALLAFLTLAAPRAQAQIVSGGYIGFGNQAVVGAPFVSPAPYVAPVVPFASPYPYVVTRPLYGPRLFYRSGWGYGPRWYGPRYYRRGYGRRWW
jgi:hypothetical protein